MKRKMESVLVCPECWGNLALSIFDQQGQEIIDGYFHCQDCTSGYMIAGGIPRMLSTDLYSNDEFME